MTKILFSICHTNNKLTHKIEIYLLVLLCVHVYVDWHNLQTAFLNHFRSLNLDDFDYSHGKLDIFVQSLE